MKTWSWRVLSVGFLLVLASPSLAAPPPAAFVQGFEVDAAGWDVLAGQYTATRVASGTHGIPSRTGGFHAEAGRYDLLHDGGSAFCRWGGYTGTFPPGGWTTGVAVYLDVGAGLLNDTRFDFTSAVSTPSLAHRRDFVFNCGYYTDTDATGSGPRFVVSASNNAGRSLAGVYPKAAGQDPLTITVTGWYLFVQSFHDDGTGVLAVDSSVEDPSSAVLKTWTRTNATDVIGVTVGGNRYGWFASVEFPFLAFDDTFRTGGPQVEPTIECSAIREILWPALFKGMFDVGLAGAIEGGLNPTLTVEVYSDEPAGAAPFAPDAELTGTSVLDVVLRLRGERLVAPAGNGRVYLLHLTVQDIRITTSHWCTVTVPTVLTAASINLVQAEAAAAALIGETTGLPPPGYVPLLTATVP